VSASPNCPTRPDGSVPIEPLRVEREDRMPRISAFYGVVIVMYYDDHPPPHFHALYAGAQVQVRTDTLEVLTGSLPRRAMALVLEWADQHRDELADSWERARRHEPLGRIDPLD
jgi:hypothetical protein